MCCPPFVGFPLTLYYQRELRHFAPWDKHRQVEDHPLPKIIRNVTGQAGPLPVLCLALADGLAQDIVPFGDAIVATEDTTIGVELCEELFTPGSWACQHWSGAWADVPPPQPAHPDGSGRRRDHHQC